MDYYHEVALIKCVPDAEPNADGHWVLVNALRESIRPKANWAALSALLPVGFHAVAIQKPTLEERE
jgi:hypothetical protein